MTKNNPKTDLRVACLSLECSKAGKHTKNCVAYGEPYPESNSKTKSNKVIKLLSNKLLCSCGFKFNGPGEFRNSDAFLTKDGESGIICPKCNREYIVKL